MEPPGRKYFKGEIVYTDWFPRGGDGLILRLEAIDRSGGNASATVEVYTKKAEDTSDGTPITDWSLNANALGPVDGFKQLIKVSATGNSLSTGLGELVRLKITGIGTDMADWILVRIFPIIFFDAAA